MPLSEEIITSRYSISGYTTNSITINEADYQQSLVLTAEEIHCPWPVDSLEGLNASSLELILDMSPEVVLLGTGVRQQFPAATIFGLFGERGIGLEVMDNGALCRTFNILVAEDRKVVAAVIQA